MLPTLRLEYEIRRCAWSIADRHDHATHINRSLDTSFVPQANETKLAQPHATGAHPPPGRWLRRAAGYRQSLEAPPSNFTASSIFHRRKAGPTRQLDMRLCSGLPMDNDFPCGVCPATTGGREPP
jgi:hypothetical protein